MTQKHLKEGFWRRCFDGLSVVAPMAIALQILVLNSCFQKPMSIGGIWRDSTMAINLNSYPLKWFIDWNPIYYVRGDASSGKCLYLSNVGHLICTLFGHGLPFINSLMLLFFDSMIDSFSTTIIEKLAQGFGFEEWVRLLINRLIDHDFLDWHFASNTNHCPDRLESLSMCSTRSVVHYIGKRTYFPLLTFILFL